MLFEFIHEALHPLISFCHCMSKISSPQTAIALDEETDRIGGGNLHYGLRTGVKREQQGNTQQTTIKKVCFQMIYGKKEKVVSHIGKAAITELNPRSLIACKLLPNESAYRWRPFCDSRIVGALCGAAIWCSVGFGANPVAVVAKTDNTLNEEHQAHTQAKVSG